LFSEAKDQIVTKFDCILTHMYIAQEVSMLITIIKHFQVD